MASPPSSGAVADGWHISGWWEVATSTGVWTVAVGSYGWREEAGQTTTTTMAATTTTTVSDR